MIPANFRGRGPYPYAKLPSYPHLVKREAVVWERFIDANPDFFDEVWYDVCVGDYRGAEDLTGEYQANREYLGKHKIDVLGRKGDLFTIIEVKHEAGKSAMGEIWVYEELFMRDYPDCGKPALIILAAEAQANIREICERNAVTLALIPTLERSEIEPAAEHPVLDQKIDLPGGLENTPATLQTAEDS